MYTKLVTYLSTVFSPKAKPSSLGSANASGEVSQTSPEAAAQLAPIAPPRKLSNKRVSTPSYLGTAVSGDAALPEEDFKTANSDLTQLRYKGSTKETIAALAKSDSDMSAAVTSAIRLAVTDEITVVARDPDGLLNVEATQMAQMFLGAMNSSSDYSVGYSSTLDLRAISESLIRESQIYGAMALEVVLNKARLPYTFKPVSTSQIKWKVRTDNTIFPVQIVGQKDISLDQPTFMYTACDQDLLTPYSSSPMESALPPMVANLDFLNDLRRVFRSVVQPRNKFVINTEKWLATLSPDVMHDREKLEQAMTDTITGIEDHINGLSPENSLVLFDTLTAEHLERGNVSLSDEWKQFSTILNAKLSAGLKAPGVVIGKDAASSTNIASTQAMLYLKSVSGIQKKLNALYSRAFTLAMRLYGYEVNVTFKYKDIDLRPKNELVAFEVMEQSRILEQLSLGMITDEEANIYLTGTLPPAGAPKLSGTMFKSNTGIIENPNSTTSVMDQTLEPDTPKEPKTA